jgi:hypothetical protein
MKKHTALALLTGTLLIAGCCSTDKPAGLVAIWPSEKAHKNTNERLVNGVNLVTEKMGKAFIFDGQSNYAEVADQPSLNLTNALTITFWAKRNDLSLHIIVEKGGDWTSGRNSYAVDLNDVYANGVFAFNYTGGWRGCSVKPDFDWHYYSVTAQNGQRDAVLYIDGVPQNITFRQGPLVISLKPSILPLHIGAQIDPNFTYYGKTLISQLAIYNRALSAEEILSLFSASHTIE